MDIWVTKGVRLMMSTMGIIDMIGRVHLAARWREARFKTTMVLSGIRLVGVESGAKWVIIEKHQTLFFVLCFLGV